MNEQAQSMCAVKDSFFFRPFLKWLSVVALFLSLLASMPQEADAKNALEAACGGASPCGVEDTVTSYVIEAAASLVSLVMTAQEATLLGIITILKEIEVESLYYYKTQLPLIMGSGAVAKTAAKIGLVKAEVKLGNAVVDAKVKDVLLETETKITTDTTAPQETEQFLCNKITACQGPVVMDEFARLVSKMVLEGLSMRYRGAGEDGNGPSYAYDDYSHHCGGNAAGVNYGTQSGDYGEDCKASTDSPLTSNANSDISASSIDLQAVLQVPTMVSKTYTTASGTVTLNVPDVNQGSTSEEDVAEKNAWIAAVEYCAKIAGPRPTPPAGSEMDTPDGRTKANQWRHCAGMQDEFLKVCADRIGMLSRPDCADDNFKNICEASLHSCNAARDAQADLPQSFRNCAAGASLYQSEYLCNTMCESSRQHQAMSLAGAGHDLQLADQALCQTSSNVWKRKVAFEDQVFIESVASMESINECWAAAE